MTDRVVVIRNTNFIAVPRAEKVVKVNVVDSRVVQATKSRLVSVVKKVAGPQVVIVARGPQGAPGPVAPLSNVNPLPLDDVADPGDSENTSRDDHVHPRDGLATDAELNTAIAIEANARSTADAAEATARAIADDEEAAARELHEDQEEIHYRTFVQATEPAGAQLGDRWVDTSDIDDPLKGPREYIKV